MTDKRGVVKLEHLAHPGGVVHQLVVHDAIRKRLLEVFIGGLWRRRDVGEQIRQQRQKQRHILCHHLTQVHVTQRTHQQRLLRVVDLVSLGLASSTQHRQNVTQTEVIVLLLGQLLLAEAVEDEELLGNFLEWVKNFNDYICKEWDDKAMKRQEESAKAVPEDEAELVEDFIEIESEVA